MGGDGGSIPHRSEMVKTRKRAEKIERDIEMAALWRACALTQQPLVPPIVTCPLGRLYGKEGVIEALLNKTLSSSALASHIKTIKDLKELKLTLNPAFKADGVDKGDRYKDLNISPFICPVSGLEMNGKHRFCVIWTCGCVLSEKCLKEAESSNCHNCGKPFQYNLDVIVLNGTEDEIEGYRAALTVKREEAKLRKLKNKADKKNESEEPC